MISGMKNNEASIGHREGEWGLQSYNWSQGKALRRLHWNRTLQGAGGKAHRSLWEECSGRREHMVQRLLRRSMLAVLSNNQEPSVPGKSERSTE